MRSIEDNGQEPKGQKMSEKTFGWWKDAIQPESKALYKLLPRETHSNLDRLKNTFFEERKALEVIIVNYSDHLIERLFNLLPNSLGSKNELERSIKVEIIAEHQMRAWYYIKLREILEKYSLEELPDEINKFIEDNSRPNN